MLLLVESDDWVVVHVETSFQDLPICLLHFWAIQLVQKILHVLNGQARKIIDLQFNDLRNISDQLQAVFGVFLQMFLAVVQVLLGLLVRKLLLDLCHLYLMFEHLQNVNTKCKNDIFLISINFHWQIFRPDALVLWLILRLRWQIIAYIEWLNSALAIRWSAINGRRLRQSIRDNALRRRVFFVVQFPLRQELVLLFAEVYHAKFLSELQKAVDHVTKVRW